MQRIPYPGGWYCERMPDGQYVQGYPNGTFLLNDVPLTHYITIDPPVTSSILQLRLAPNGAFFAGPDHASFDIIEWDGAKFEKRGPNCGQSPAAYWPDSRLEVTRTCDYPPQGSQGIRWIDSVIHYGADTRQPAGDGIFEWTELDGIKVGQGDAGGIAIKYNGIKYVLEQGQLTDFVRFNKSGNRLGIACWNHSINAGVHFLLTVNEIVSLPLYPSSTTPPVPMPPERPRVTISSYEPKSGPAPLKTRAVAELSGGQADTLTWRADNQDVVTNPASDLDHTFTFNTAGKHNIGVRVNGPGGSDQTGLLREVTVTEPNPTPIPPDPIPPQPSVPRYYIMTDWGTYVYVDSEGILKHGQQRTAFSFENIGGDNIFIKASKYVAAEPPDGVMKADRDNPSSDSGSWEIYKGITNSDGTFSFFANGTRKYVSANGDGNVRANRDQLLTQERFQLEVVKADASIKIGPGGKFFRRSDDSRLTIIQSSDFSMYKKHLDGVDYQSVLAERQELEFNTLRVWLLNTTVIPGGLEPKNYPNFYDELVPFSQVCATYGMIVEFTVFTQAKTLMPNFNDQITHFNRTVDALRGQPNVLIELVNEGDQHDNMPEAPFTRPSGILASHGSAGADNEGIQPVWDYTQYHSNDLNEFQRKVGHNAMEMADKFGVPCLSNENTRYPDRDSNEIHAEDAAEGGALLCAGSCFHSQSGKLSNHFDPTERRCAEAWVRGAKSVPLEFQDGFYTHRKDLEHDNIIRVYSRTTDREYIIEIRA